MFITVILILESKLRQLTKLCQKKLTALITPKTLNLETTENYNVLTLPNQTACLCLFIYLLLL